MDYSYKSLVKKLKRGGVLPKNNQGYDYAFDNKNAWYIFYKHYFTNIICSLFEWYNLPEGIDETFLEKNLNANGFLGFFYDDAVGFIVQRGTLNQDIDLYDRPKVFRVVSPASSVLARQEYKINNYIDEVDPDNCVLIENDYFRNSSFYWVDLFASKLAEIEHSIQLARNSVKLPYIILTNEDNKLSVRNFYQQIETGEPVIYLKEKKSKDALDDGSLLDKIQVLNSGTQNTQILKDLYDERTLVFNTFLNFIGVDSVAVSGKKERLVSSEASSNDALVATSLQVKLDARRRSADLINRTFNLNIEVDIKTPLEIHNIPMFSEWDRITSPDIRNEILDSEDEIGFNQERKDIKENEREE